MKKKLNFSNLASKNYLQTDKNAKMLRQNNTSGITLIALVVTIIVLLILAAVTINLTIGENGIIKRANDAKDETRAAALEEQVAIWKLEVETYNETDTLKGSLPRTLEGFLEELVVKSKLLNATEAEDIYKSPNKEIEIGNRIISFKVDKILLGQETANVPTLVDGMTPIKFTEPTDSSMGSAVTTTASDKQWYDYTTSKWANAQTQDGSMWVWIPRYAYKITYTNASNKSSGGNIDIKFLIGSTDDYYDENGNRKTAQRAKTAEEDIDTTADYTVHPAFTNESSIGFRNGGWDKELTGIWVAKFEAGFASGNNSATVARSNVKYTQTTAWVAGVEAGGSDSSQAARNWLDGTYGTNLPNISYPVFQPKTYAMNYINVNDAYNVSRALTDSGNIYGFKNTADSHLMKNSEWGAVSYLSHSKYGTNGQEIAINNANLNNSVKSVYAITGCTDGSTSNGAKTVTIGNINGVTGNTPSTEGMYVWNQKTGTKASSTMNMTGVYDMSGGTWEREASYVANGNGNLKTYGASLAYEGDVLKTASTKYTTVYPHDSAVDKSGANIDSASSANYAKNTKIYGDGIRETSTAGTGSTSWNGDRSYFTGLHGPFFIRGGNYGTTSVAGTFCFVRTAAGSGPWDGFRAVVVPGV